MGIHAVFDILAYLTAAVIGVLYRKRFFRDWKHPVPKALRTTYLLVLLEGVMLGGFLFGTLELTASDVHGILGKSVLGCIVGGQRQRKQRSRYRSVFRFCDNHRNERG